MSENTASELSRDDVQILDLEIDVSAAAGLGVAAHTGVTVTLPAPGDMAERPIVAVALPGAGYNRRYFGAGLTGGDSGGQAAWHARRGWVFVAVTRWASERPACLIRRSC